MTSTNKKTGLRTKKLVPVIVLIALSINAFSMDISGNISGVLTTTNSPYHITNNLTIPAGDKLTIEPGVEMIFNGSYSMTVNGTLQVLGNATDSILFTAADSSIGWLGIDMYNVDASSDSCLFEYCRFSYAKRMEMDDCGGAIYTQYDKTRFSHCSFISNTANYRGAAIYANNANGIKIDACVFKNNNAPRVIAGDMAGAAVQTWYCNNTIVSNCIFYHNTSNGVGALTLYMGSNNYAINCVMYQNNATYGGGMVYGNAINCIIRENTGTGSEINVAWLDSDICCFIEGVGWDEDPQFVDANNGDFRLKPTSPCINIGTNSVLSNTPSMDFGNNIRLVGENIDLGACEFKPSIFTSINSLNYGDPLSATDINGMADIDGNFSYNPDLGSILPAGDNALKLTFTGTDFNKFGAIDTTITIHVDKAPLTVTANDTTQVYGTENPTFDVTYTGFVNNEDVNVIDTKAVAKTLATAISDAGHYDIIAENGADNNYEMSYVNGKLTIGKAPLVVTANDTTKVYGTENPTFDVTYAGFVNNEDETVLDQKAVITCHATETSSVGHYDILVSGATDVNYEVTTYTKGTLSITKANPIITWNNPDEITYGTALSATQLNATTNVAGTIVYTPAMNTILNAGTAQTLETSFTPDDMVNYNSKSHTITLDVSKAPLTITANDTTKVYGTENPTFDITYTGFVNNEDVNVIDNKATATTVATATSDAGQYDIIAENGTDNNYEMNYVNGHLTVSKAPLTVTANDTTKVYGTENPTFELTYAGFVNNEDVNVIDTKAVAKTLVTVTSDAGQYDIIAENGTDNNYEMNYVNGHLTVSKAPLTVTANDTTKVYGTENPTFEVTYSGFVNNEDVNVIDTKAVAKTLATVTSDAGQYDIIADNGDDNNYDMSYVNGHLTVSKAPLTVTANDTTKVYGTENPTFDVTYAGFVNNEDVNVINTKAVAKTLATVTSDAGQYDIIAENGTDNNYEMNYVNGHFIITQATPILTWETPASITIGKALSENQLNATANIEGQFLYTPEAGTFLAVGDAQALIVEFTPTDIKNYRTVQDTVYIDVKMITGITNMNEINIRLYPNPVTSGFYIQGLEDQTSSIELFDLSGKKLLQQNISNNEQVAIENLPAGTYIVRINTQNKTSHIKLIKQ